MAAGLLSPRAPLFGVNAFALAEGDAPVLQAFLEANPAYFIAVGGQPAGPSEALQEFRDLPPSHMPFSGRWIVGFTEPGGRLVGMASVLSDFIASGVGHLGLFIVATALHGTGRAGELYGMLEGWMKTNGARWIRLGVVMGNGRAEGFWRKQGYVEVRKRLDVPIGERTNTLRVLVKPLDGGALAEYLRLVARDHPESTLP